MDGSPRHWSSDLLRRPEVRFSLTHLRPGSSSPPCECSEDSCTSAVANSRLSSSRKFHTLNSTVRRLDSLARPPPSTSTQDARVYSAPVGPASGSKAPKVIVASTRAILRSAGEAWDQAVAITSWNHAKGMGLQPVRPGTLGAAQMDAQGKRQIVGEAIEVMAEMQRRLMAEFGGELVEETANRARISDRDVRMRNSLVVPEVERTVINWRPTCLQQPVTEGGNASLQLQRTRAMAEGSYKFENLAGAKWEDEAGTIDEREQGNVRLAQRIIKFKKSGPRARSPSVDEQIKARGYDALGRFPSILSGRALSTVQNALGSSTSPGVETPKSLQQGPDKAVEGGVGDEMEEEFAVVEPLAGGLVEVSEEWTGTPDLTSSIGDSWDVI